MLERRIIIIIDVEEILSLMAEIIYCNTEDIMYCICYNNGTDKRILIKYGIFQTKEKCEEFIKAINNNNLESYPIKINRSEKNILLKEDIFSKTPEEFSFLYQNLVQAFRLERSIRAHINEDIECLTSLKATKKQILNEIQDKYHYLLKNGLLYDLLPPNLKMTVLQDEEYIEKYAYDFNFLNDSGNWIEYINDEK